MELKEVLKEVIGKMRDETQKQISRIEGMIETIDKIEKGSFDKDPVKDTCFGNVMYCCSTVKPCLKRDIALLSLGIDRKEFREIKERLMERLRKAKVALVLSKGVKVERDSLEDYVGRIKDFNVYSTKMGVYYYEGKEQGIGVHFRVGFLIDEDTLRILKKRLPDLESCCAEVKDPYVKESLMKLKEAIDSLGGSLPEVEIL